MKKLNQILERYQLENSTLTKENDIYREKIQLLQSENKQNEKKYEEILSKKEDEFEVEKNFINKLNKEELEE